jgi:hypothetical protein
VLRDIATPCLSSPLAGERRAARCHSRCPTARRLRGPGGYSTENQVTWTSSQRTTVLLRQLEKKTTRISARSTEAIRARWAHLSSHRPNRSPLFWPRAVGRAKMNGWSGRKKEVKRCFSVADITNPSFRRSSFRRSPFTVHRSSFIVPTSHSFPLITSDRECAVHGVSPSQPETKVSRLHAPSSVLTFEAAAHRRFT